MKNGLIALALFAAIVVALCLGLWLRRGPDLPPVTVFQSPASSAPSRRPSQPSTLNSAPVAPPVSEAATVQQSAIAAAPPPATPPVTVPPMSPELAGVTPLAVMENMRTAIRLYGQTFHGNPVGNNAEITKALAGDNPRQINFLKEDGNRINSDAELVDVWGTPYFFHQLSGTETEIRSAGPDKLFWNLDDIVIK